MTDESTNAAHNDWPVMCPTPIPEPHELGEFPMTCYRCHLEADS